MRKWINLCESQPDRLDLLVSAIEQSGEFHNKLTDVRKLIKPVWCAHFSYDAKEIAANGFTKGSPLDIPNWAATNGVDFENAGYNFAVDTRDENALSFWSSHAHEAVIFRAMGVRTFHYDDFHQVIFWGPDVIRPIYAIECCVDSFVNAEDEDWRITMKDNHRFNGKPTPFNDLILKIENSHA